MTTPTDNAALMQALAEYAAAEANVEHLNPYHTRLGEGVDALVAMTVAADLLIRALQARNRELEAALKPFAQVYVDWFNRRILDVTFEAWYANYKTKPARIAYERALDAQPDDAAPILYALDFDAYADWYRQTTGRDTPFEPHQLFTIEHNMGKVASEDYVYVHVASVPGCSMPRRFLKAWTPALDDAAEG